MSHILLIFKYCIYQGRENEKLSLKSLIAWINKIRDTEELTDVKELKESLKLLT